MDSINWDILLPQQMLNAIKHITDDIFLWGREHIGAHALCMQHSPTAAALSTSFLLNHAPPNSPWAERIDYKMEGLIQQREYESWVRKQTEKLKKSRSDWLNSGDALIQHLSEKMRFSCFAICQVVQKHTLFEVA